MAAQETRALLTARKLLQAKLHAIELSLRGILRGFGLGRRSKQAETPAGAGASAGHAGEWRDAGGDLAGDESLRQPKHPTPSKTRCTSLATNFEVLLGKSLAVTVGVRQVRSTPFLGVKYSVSIHSCRSLSLR